MESLAALQEQLQDGLAVVGSSSTSRFAAVHADRVKLWQAVSEFSAELGSCKKPASFCFQARFEKVEELLAECCSCQERFRFLEGVFSASELQKQLPTEFLAFQPVESTWKALLQRLAQRPTVVDLALDPQNLQTLRQLGEARLPHPAAASYSIVQTRAALLCVRPWTASSGTSMAFWSRSRLIATVAATVRGFWAAKNRIQSGDRAFRGSSSFPMRCFYSLCGFLGSAALQEPWSSWHGSVSQVRCCGALRRARA